MPFNIASYALLTMMVAQVTNLKPGEFIHTFGDAHLYSNHVEQAHLQLSRAPKALPTMRLNPDVKDLFAFRYEDFTLENYDPHPAIRAPIAAPSPLAHQRQPFLLGQHLDTEVAESGQRCRCVRARRIGEREEACEPEAVLAIDGDHRLVIGRRSGRDGDNPTPGVEESLQRRCCSGIDVDAMAPLVEGKFASAFVRATKPAAKSCCGPTCCS